MNQTTDKDYADLLVRLNAIPAQQPVKREVRQQQQREWLIEDLLAVNGEAPW